VREQGKVTLWSSWYVVGAQFISRHLPWAQLRQVIIVPKECLGVTAQFQIRVDLGTPAGKMRMRQAGKSVLCLSGTQIVIDQVTENERIHAVG
jgi:hypothetical protein